MFVGPWRSIQASLPLAVQGENARLGGMQNQQLGLYRFIVWTNV